MAWHDSAQSLISSLGLAERAAFQVPASPDDCIATLIVTQHQKTKLERIFNLIGPTIIPLERFEKAVSVIIQVDTGIESPVWGPLRIVVTLSAAHFRTLESIAMIIHKIISSLLRFPKYNELLETDKSVQDAIGALYCDFLDFCVRVTRLYSTASLGASLSIDEDFRRVVESIRNHDLVVERVASITGVEETQEYLDKVKTYRQVHERENLQRWLSSSTVADDLRKHLSRYTPRSCDDTLASEEFKSFLSSDDAKKSQVLALQGLPGTGKTTTAAFIVDHLKNKGYEVLYYFFKENDAEKRTLVQCVRTILSQLLQLEERLYDIVEPIYQKSSRVVADSLVETMRALDNALSHSTAKQIFVVVDALDESASSNEISQWITTLCTSHGQKLRVFNTSRPSASLSRSSGSFWTFLSTTKFDQGSLKKYIRGRLEGNEVITGTDFEDQVVEQVASASDGLWLYARVFMDTINALPYRESVEKQLKELPKGFMGLYTHRIRTYSGAYNPMELKIAQQLYLWIDTADYLPDFLILEDDRLGYDMLENIFQYANDGKHLRYLRHLASRVAHPLIEVSDSKIQRDDSWAFELDFIHCTAAQFLSESNNIPRSNIPLVLQPRRLRHLHRAAVAQWYFTECDRSEEMLQELVKNEGVTQRSRSSYFGMAYGLWNAFFLDEFPEIEDAKEALEAEQMLQKLTEFITWPACLRWIETAILINYKNQFPHLLYNAVKAWKAAQGNTNHPFAPYAAFSEARMYFFENFVYVLATTGVGAEFVPAELMDSAEKYFPSNKLAERILEVGERWKRLAFPETSANEMNLPLRLRNS
ncbi:hypothetical protein M426DRAFT_188767 [Hypoxylon sp. CI-4A]|nr:hypothetical protein M426DRAFT_188767 [Hypoxylon sp. CI-4A]